MRKFTLMILLVFFFASCQKLDLPATATMQKTMLSGYNSGNGATVSVKWRLSALSINSVQQSLSSSQLLFQKKYDASGGYTDTDGIVGSWNVPAADSLVEIYSNYPASPITQGFRITSLSSTQLIVNYKTSTSNVSVTYTAN